MWNPWRNGPSGWIYIAMLAPNFVVSPGLLQKVYGARDDRAVRVGVGLNAVCLLLYALVPVLLGMSARVLHPGLPNADRELALPLLFMHDLPFWVGALGLAAVFSAEVSAADAVLFMLATSLSQDLYKRFVNPAASDRQVRDGRARRVGLRRACRRHRRDAVEERGRRARLLLHAGRRQPVRADRRRSVSAPAAGARRAGRDRRRHHRGGGGRSLERRAGRSACSRPRCAGWRPRRWRLRWCRWSFPNGEWRDTRAVRSDGEDRGGHRRGIGHRRGGRARLREAGGAGRLPRRQRGRGAARRGEGDGRRRSMRRGRRRHLRRPGRRARVHRSRREVRRRHRHLHAGDQRAEADPQVHRRGAVARARRQPQGELQRPARGRARDDGAQEGQHHPLLLDPTR